jgi:hypothetical protein
VGNSDQVAPISFSFSVLEEENQGKANSRNILHWFMLSSWSGLAAHQWSHKVHSSQINSVAELFVQGDI